VADLGAYEEPVRFDWDAGTKLAADLRALAKLLDEQIPHRNTFAATARTDWKGVYEQQFGEHMRICTGDAGRFARAMEECAHQVDELGRLAHEEQKRRNLAKEWKRKDDEWHHQRDQRSGFAVVGDAIAEKGFGADDGEPEPPDPPKSETHYTSDPPPPAARA
jgi:hypothetical protein